MALRLLLLLLLLGGLALLEGGAGSGHSEAAAVTEKKSGDFKPLSGPRKGDTSTHQEEGPFSPKASSSQDALAISSHSLHYLIWAIWEPGWRHPVSTSVVYVDDQLIGRFDRDTAQCLPQSSWVKEISHNDTSFWTSSMGWDPPSSIAMDLMALKDLFPQSRGVQTLQVLSGCELSGDNQTSRGFVKYGYNGRDFLSLDLANLSWTAMDVEATPIKRKWDADRNRGESWKVILENSCVEWLETYLRYGKKSLERTTTPIIQLNNEFGFSGPDTLTCQLFGFYPKEAEVTWRKDGEPLKLSDIRTGGLLPNSDGTYNIWATIYIDPKEADRYSCRVRGASFGALLRPPYRTPGETGGEGGGGSQGVTKGGSSSREGVTSSATVSQAGSLFSWALWLLFSCWGPVHLLHQKAT